MNGMEREGSRERRIVIKGKARCEIRKGVRVLRGLRVKGWKDMMTSAKPMRTRYSKEDKVRYRGEKRCKNSRLQVCIIENKKVIKIYEILTMDSYRERIYLILHNICISQTCL